MGRIVSLVNPKGGTCKSTLALCLGAASGNSLIVDLDPQGSIWSWFQERQPLLKQGEDKGPAVEFYGIDEPTGETLEEYAQRFETVFVDCPGESEAGIRTRTALVYSDLVIIPVRESEFDAASLFDHLLPLLEDAQQSNEREGKIAILPVMCHVNAKRERTVTRFRSLDRAVLPTAMKSRSVYKKFSGKGSTLEEYAETERYGFCRKAEKKSQGQTVRRVVRVGAHSGKEGGLQTKIGQKACGLLSGQGTDQKHPDRGSPAGNSAMPFGKKSGRTLPVRQNKK